MHVSPAYLAAIDWNYILRQSPARIVFIAAFVTTTLQMLKRFFPLLSGGWAIAANIAFSSAAVVAATVPDQLFTPQTFANVIITALGAAGIHGTGKLMSQPAPSMTYEQFKSQPNPAAKFPVLLLVASLAVVGLGGCNSWERQTYQTLAATQATINQAQDDYEAGSIPHTYLAFNAITKAKDAQKLAVQGFAAYARLKDTKGSQTAIDAQQQIVAQALALLPQLIIDVKALYRPLQQSAPPPTATPAKPIITGRNRATRLLPIAA